MRKLNSIGQPYIRHQKLNSHPELDNFLNAFSPKINIDTMKKKNSLSVKKSEITSSTGRYKLTRRHFVLTGASAAAGLTIAPQYMLGDMQQGLEFFIDTNGNDGNTGTKTQPFATLARARDEVRKLIAKGLESNVTVWVRGGIYPVDAPVNFGPEDSGTVTYSAYPDEIPVFDAGRRITSWKEQKLGKTTVWVADVKDIITRTGYFRSLFVSGERRTRARFPKQGFYRIADVPGITTSAALFAGSDSFRVTPGEVKNWRNLSDAEIRVFHYWTDERMPIESVDESTGMVKCSRTSIFSLVDSYSRKWAEYWIDNVFEALSEPGEWYLDRSEGKLYYAPMPGETKKTTEVVAAGTYQFIRLHGIPEEKKLITGLTFKGLHFRHSDWIQPEQDGKYFDPYVPEKQRRQQDATHHFLARDTKVGVKYGATPQSSVHTPGTISLVGAQKISILDCQISHVGYYGIDLADGCTDNTIEGNTIMDIGAGGVKIDGANYPSDPLKFSGNNRVTDNLIKAGGRVFQSSAGIVITHGFGNIIAHNEVCDMFQSGIAVGWEWSRIPQVSRDNRIEKNHLYNLGQDMSSDIGGVYILGIQPGTMVRNNLIHNIKHRNYGGWGIYTDARTAHIIVENNIVYDVSSECSYNQGVGSVNREITVRNNIFAFAGTALVYLPENYARKVQNIPGFNATYERNIFISGGEPIYYAQAGPASEHPYNDLFLSDLNIMWDVTGKQPICQKRPGGEGDTMMLEQWRSIGSDLHSLVADPKVRDWKNRDFTLSQDSPAFLLGFRSIVTSDIGPRNKENRISLEPPRPVRSRQD